MDSYRSVLEVAKWLPPKDCLLSASVTATWRQACDSSELWALFTEDSLFAPSPGLTPKALFRCRRNPLALFSPKHLHLYIPDTQLWQLLPLSSSLPTARTSSWAVTPTGYFIISGGFKGIGRRAHSREVKATAFQVHQSGLVVTLQPMVYRRMCHGMLVVNDICYAFGGHNGFDAMTATEKLSLVSLTAKQEWVGMRAMLGPRYCCNPCEYRGAIYLVGGVTFDSEVFYPLTETFEELDLKVSMGNSCAVVMQGELIVLLPTEMHRKGEGDWRTEKQKRQRTYGNMKPVLRDCRCWIAEAYEGLTLFEVSVGSGETLSSISPQE